MVEKEQSQESYIEKAANLGLTMESDISSGVMFLSESNRMWLTELVEGNGVNLEPFSDGHVEFGMTGRSVNREQCNRGFTYVNGEKITSSTLEAQTAFLEATLGREGLLLLVSEAVVEESKTKGGKVFKGKYLASHPEYAKTLSDDDVRILVGNFLNNGLDDSHEGIGYSSSRAQNEGRYVRSKKKEEKTPEDVEQDKLEKIEGRQDDWKKNVMYRMEATISATYRVLELLAASPEEAEKLQFDKYTVWHLTERVLRGIENESKEKVVKTDGSSEFVITKKFEENVKRHVKDDELRELAVGGLSSILKQLARNQFGSVAQ